MPLTSQMRLSTLLSGAMMEMSTHTSTSGPREHPETRRRYVSVARNLYMLITVCCPQVHDVYEKYLKGMLKSTKAKL